MGLTLSKLSARGMSLLRYSAADWRKSEFQYLDRKTSKLLTMRNGLHPKSNVDVMFVHTATYLYIPRWTRIN